MKQIIFHPAFPKTGTTFLQNQVFSKLSDIKELEEFNEKRLSKGKYFNFFKSNFYTKDEQKIYNYYLNKENYLKELITKISNSNNSSWVISDPGLLDPFGSPGISNIFLLKEIIDALKKKFDLKIKFLITIRSQEELIASYFSYRNYYFKNKNFSELLSDELFMNNFKLSNLINHIIGIFDEEFLILPLELLSNDKKLYFKKLEEFLGIQINSDEIENQKKINSNSKMIDNKKYYSIREFKESKIYKFLVYFNSIMKKNDLYNKKIRNLKIFQMIKDKIQNLQKANHVSNFHISESQSKIIKDYFREDNKILEKIANIDLKNLNYY